jgi:hypothetical protein
MVNKAIEKTILLLLIPTGLFFIGIGIYLISTGYFIGFPSLLLGGGFTLYPIIVFHEQREDNKH